MLIFTLILMGLATALIGLLPTYAQIGAWAPVLLITLRVLQGISAGGEWGGAALMSVESAPGNKRSLFGCAPQIGTPLGLIISTGVLWLLTEGLGRQAMAEWGWRLPFLFSIALIVLGLIIRRTLEESPVFEALRARRERSSAPLAEVLGHHGGKVLNAALGLSYGPQAALYAEMFPAKVRYSGVSLGFALGAILGGAFAPAIAQWLIASSGKSWMIGVYLAALSLVSLIAVSRVKAAKAADFEVP